MPLDDDYKDLPDNKMKSTLKNVSAQKSIFESMEKKPNQDDLDKKVQNFQKKEMSLKERTAELAFKLKKIMADKTLPQNKNVFSTDMEKEILSAIMELAVEVNGDPNELDGMGSLSWIAQLFNISLSFRDRMNKMEYGMLQLEKKYNDLVKKEVLIPLDAKKDSE